jgi:hypothetical protein
MWEIKIIVYLKRQNTRKKNIKCERKDLKIGGLTPKA